MKHQTYKILFVLSILLLGISLANAQSTQETLSQYLTDLQKNPNDNALREKIIKHVQGMSPVPAIPAEAERFEGRGEFAVKSAKSEADYLDAAREYEKALLLAPWVSGYYFNQGIAYEKGGKLKEAKRSFEFYLLAAPNATDAREVRKRIAGLEYAEEKAVRAPIQSPVTEAKRDPFEELLRKIDGRRYTSSFENGVQGVIEVQGRFYKFGWYNKNGVYSVPASNHLTEIKGLVTLAPITVFSPVSTLISNTFTISEDGSWIKFRGTYRDGTFVENYYMWQR